MIAILISAVLCQSSGAELGAKIRYESNQMIMRMQNVPYDVADVLNGSNYSVEEATAIAAQRRQQREVEIRREMAAIAKGTRESVNNMVKTWSRLNDLFDKVANGETTFPADKVEPLRGMIRESMSKAEGYSKNMALHRNVRNAAKMHARKAEAALKVLETK